MTVEALAAALLAVAPTILTKGAETLAGQVLKDAWGAVKSALGGKPTGSEAEEVEGGRTTPSPQLTSDVAAFLASNPELAAKVKEAVSVSAPGGIAVGTQIAEKVANIHGNVDKLEM